MTASPPTPAQLMGCNGINACPTCFNVPSCGVWCAFDAMNGVCYENGANCPTEVKFTQIRSVQQCPVATSPPMTPAPTSVTQSTVFLVGVIGGAALCTLLVFLLIVYCMMSRKSKQRQLEHRSMRAFGGGLSTQFAPGMHPNHAAAMHPSSLPSLSSSNVWNGHQQARPQTQQFQTQPAMYHHQSNGWGAHEAPSSRGWNTTGGFDHGGGGGGGGGGEQYQLSPSFRGEAGPQAQASPWGPQIVEEDFREAHSSRYYEETMDI